MEINNRSASFNYRNLSMNSVQTFNREPKRTEIVLNEQKIELNAENQEKVIGNAPPVELIHGPTEKNPMDEFNKVLNNIDTLTTEEKNKIRDAIEISTSSKYNGATDGYPLAIMQTGFELSYLNQHYIPGEFQEQMQTEIDRYTDVKLNTFLGGAQENHMQGYKILKTHGFLTPEKAKQMHQTATEFEQGTHYIQHNHNVYRDWFNELTTSDSFVADYEKLLQKFEELQISQSNGAIQNAKTNVEHIKNGLRDQWNTFSNALPDKQAPKASTKDEPLINLTV